MLSRNKVAVPEGAAGSPPLRERDEEFCRQLEVALTLIGLLLAAIKSAAGSLAQLVRASS